MRDEHVRPKSPLLQPRRADFSTHLVQAILGILCWLGFELPYVRAVRGRPPRRGHPTLFVCNHVSLLDTLLLGGMFWRRRATPILVLGDRGTWRVGWLKRFLSWRLGFLIERGGVVKERITELKAFARSSADFHLIVFPEGTRGDGRRLGELQPGVYFIAREAKLPIVPIHIRGMELLSSKTGGVHPLRALRRLDVEFGEPMLPEAYLPMRREEFMAALRTRMEEGFSR